MITRRILLPVVLLALLAPWGADARPDEKGGGPHTRVALISERTVVAPGESFDVGIHLKMDPGWHTYWKDPGDSGLATSVEWKLPSGFTAGPLRWPKPEIMKEAGLVTYGYENEVVLLAKITASVEGTKRSQVISLGAKVDWLECKEVCVPGSAVVSVTLRVGHFPSAHPASTALLERFRKLIPPDDGKPDKEIGGRTTDDGLVPRGAGGQESESKGAETHVRPSVFGLRSSVFLLLFAAFLGGLILNVMPCVLPVIAIKILSFVQQGGGERGARRLGAWFVAGVIISFWVLGLAVVGLQSAGREIGWGFQFQDPRFLLAMALVTTVVAMNFFGVFEIAAGGGALQAAGALASRRGDAGAFFNGVLATALATPCTAPFLSTAMFYAFSQPVPVVLLFFTVAGAGLASPYALLSWKPSLLRWLPKPGAWMLRFKQLMGFPMLATSLWLAWTLGAAHGNDAAAVLLAILLVASLATWAIGTWLPRHGWVVAAVVALSAWLGSAPLMKALASPRAASASAAEGGIAWRAWSPSALEAALRETRQPVFVDFTARWCLTCQVNQRTSIEVPAVEAKMSEIGAIAFLADYTRRNDDITRALKSFGRSGVPLCVVYPADRSQSPIVLPEVLTPGVVLDALARAAAPAQGTQ
ncbi:MAG: protein-disulfide reductase DsbD family protein [Verrucomicrobiia bacterium]